ncbi:helicase C-terminal domain-containing protein [Pedococcus sp. 5OH_020]|uniref:helicase C-terminal domain-containing protein n=1 Tax=Pedococcus sp. 5OH_020 TaxID=2989814 RepID=UPI0022E9FD72|nr:helicase C-terminal domain-containing protein [Pedococcus sp. 5OH_020]
MKIVGAQPCPPLESSIGPAVLGSVGAGDPITLQAVLPESVDPARCKLHCAVWNDISVLPADYVTEHVELGYASTAHRAQARTVDTAHADLSAGTTREGLYVMASRGRETNRLYIDTSHDPDPATGHEEPVHADRLEVVQLGIANTGADTSATQAGSDQRAAASTPWRLVAHGAHLATSATQRGRAIAD